jgi:hypothetical protein
VDAPPLADFIKKSLLLVWAYIAYLRLFLPEALRKNQEASPQSALSLQRAGGAGGER